MIFYTWNRLTVSKQMNLGKFKTVIYILFFDK